MTTGPDRAITALSPDAPTPSAASGGRTTGPEVTMRNAFAPAVLQALVLTAMAAGLALTLNAVRPDALPLFGDWSVAARVVDAAGQSLIVSLDEAARLHETGAVVFMDARSQDEYAMGHVKGARSMPEIDTGGLHEKAMEGLSKDVTVIAYCDGEACQLSHDLALRLKGEGFADVRVLVNGWSAWLGAGLPTEAGP